MALPEKEENRVADYITKELERMNDVLKTEGHCSTIEPAMIHRLRIDI